MDELFNTESSAGEHWISISDLMSGLMIIFMFIAISFMHSINEDKDNLEKQTVILQELTDKLQDDKELIQSDRDRIESIVKTYELLKESLYLDLYNEFSDDLIRWNAIIDRDSLSVTFKEPEVFFTIGQSELQPVFQDILSNFFPRYVGILSSEKYKEDIDEIRIEGHTSSEWTGSRNELEAYIQNMRLSQDRARSVLEYVMALDTMKVHRNWLINFFTANGLSYSQMIIKDGVEDPEASRRVEFRVRTKAERRIEEIIHRDS